MTSYNDKIKELGMDKLGFVTASEILHNVNYDKLYNDELAASGVEKASITKLGALSIDTGRFTGRSAKDKYIVTEESSENNVWWNDKGSDNKPLTQKKWDILKENSLKQLNGKKLYVMDLYCGANKETRLSIRLITEIAWKAHFAKNMFIRPSEEELSNFEPDWTIIDACKTRCDNWQELELNSEVYVAFHVAQRTTLIGGTWYGGEIKKGIFTMMNYFLPLKDIGAFHCSANMGDDGSTALFFGLSGTGKTTLSATPDRKLIGDDEHGWDDEGVFNFEGGCYAKCINLSKENEPDIYNSIKKDALLENVVLKNDGEIAFDDNSKTENTRVSYPIYHIDNIVKPVSKGNHPKDIIFLTCDAFGVLPPVAKLTPEQAKYQYLSGYTAKVSGTEIGITEPVACFSPCFGGPFLLLHPTKYGDILEKKMKEHNSNAYLVNTGWTGGAYGTGSRMSIKVTRKIIDAILGGGIENSEWSTFDLFNFKIPKQLSDIDAKVLNPRETWTDKKAYDKSLSKLASMFRDNFKKYEHNASAASLKSHGPSEII